MDISQFANSYLGDTGKNYLLDLPKTRSLLGSPINKYYEIISSEEKTEPVIASFFWQVYLHSPELRNQLGLFGASADTLARSDKLIVSHGSVYPLYDLMILDPHYPNQAPISFSITPNREKLHQGWEEWKSNKLSITSKGSYAKNSSSKKLSNLVAVTDFNFIWSLHENRDFKVLWMKEPTRNYSAWLPNSPHGVAPDIQTQVNSTVGVYATNENGKRGCTVSLHALKETHQNLSLGLVIGVGASQAKVLSIDEITDSCFVEIDWPLEAQENTGVRSPLSGVSPRQREKAQFNGIASGLKTIEITGWSPDLPFVAPYNQLKIFTTPGTNPGDSGSALTDSDENILGFAFYRTGIAESVQYSAWIWADSVFSAHTLH